MKVFQVRKNIKEYPILVGITLICLLMMGLLGQKYMMQRQNITPKIIPADLSREETVDQFQSPEDLIKYVMAALKNKDLDLMLRACAIDERVLANPFYITLETEASFGYDSVLPPSGNYSEYQPLSSLELANYYQSQYVKFQAQIADAVELNVKKIGILEPEQQLNTENLHKSVKFASEWGATQIVQMTVLVESNQNLYGMDLTVINYNGYWKVFDFGQILTASQNREFVYATTAEDFEANTGTADCGVFLKKLDNKTVKEENADNKKEIIKVKEPAKEILSPNYFVVGASYGKDPYTVIQRFVLALQKKDPVGALSYCNIDRQINNLDYVSSKVLQIQCEFARQVKYLYYGLQGQEYLPDEQPLNVLGETAGEILEKLNPDRMPYLEIKEMLELGDDQYVVFSELNGRCYINGYTLIQYDEGWQIASLSADKENLTAGEVREISWQKYRKWTGNP